MTLNEHHAATRSISWAARINAPIDAPIDAPMAVRRGSRPADPTALRWDQSRVRCGYTLLELILVLGILVVLAGITVPMAIDTLDTHRLRASADRIQGAFAEAINQAVRSGNEVAFYYKAGFRRYFVLEFNPLSPRALPQVPEEDWNRDSMSDVRSNLLEIGVTFAGADVGTDSRSQVSEVTDVPNYQRILFYPDGTAQSARVYLANESGVGIRVDLRSLTGTALPSDIMFTSDFQ